MFTRREQEGYLLIDHSDSPGLTEAEALESGKMGLPVPPQALGKGVKTEVPAIICAHCEVLVVMNPNRTRDREICQYCDKYVCDTCKLNVVLTGECQTMKKHIDQWWDQVDTGKTYTGIFREPTTGNTIK